MVWRLWLDALIVRLNMTAASCWRPWFAAGLLTGLGTLVRPETPLLLVALAWCLSFAGGVAPIGASSCAWGCSRGVGLFLPLVPWAARNCVRFHEVQFLSPRYAATPDEYTPRGLYAWTATWLVRFRDVYLVPWNIGSDPVRLTRHLALGVRFARRARARRPRCSINTTPRCR